MDTRRGFRRHREGAFLSREQLVLGIRLECCEAGLASKTSLGPRLKTKSRIGLCNDGHIIYRGGEKRGRGSKNYTPKLMISGRQRFSIARHVLDSQPAFSW
jgi:hypothetical protein